LPLKLRGAVFDTYDGERWTRRSEDTWVPLPHVGDDFRLAPGGSGDVQKPSVFDVLLESLEPPYLFVPQGTGKIRTEPVVRLGRFTHRALRRNGAGMLRYDDDAKVGIRYRVFITGAEALGGPEDDPSFLALPASSARLVAAAREIGRGADDERKAASIIVWLQREHAYGPPAASADRANALARFLFEERRGTCEHFATSAVLMLRAVGIPARFVTGFGSAAFNPLGGYYAVRTRSAHAWVEAFIGGAWRTIEATPPAPPGLQIEGPSSLALLLDALRMRWHKYVIGFDINTQMELGSWLMDKKRSSAFDGVDVPWRIVFAIALAAALGVAAWRFARKKRVRRRSRLGRSALRTREAAEATAIYFDLEKRLRALGYARPKHVTPTEHLSALPADDAELLRCASIVTARYNDVRFGGGAFEPGERERLREEIRGLRRPDQTTEVAEAS